jgi:hypothetical protein
MTNLQLPTYLITASGGDRAHRDDFTQRLGETEIWKISLSFVRPVRNCLRGLPYLTPANHVIPSPDPGLRPREDGDGLDVRSVREHVDWLQ